MNVLLINNKTFFLKELKRALNGNKITIIPFNKIDLNADYSNFDRVILSGGHGLNILNHSEKYAREINLIKTVKVPVLGICLGFELIGFTFNEKLKLLKTKEKGIITIKKTREDILLKGVDKIEVYENHKWSIKKTKNLLSLAKSKDGIEITKHPKKSIWGVQFHPEMCVDKTEGWKLLDNFMKMNS